MECQRSSPVTTEEGHPDQSLRRLRDVWLRIRMKAERRGERKRRDSDGGARINGVAGGRPVSQSGSGHPMDQTEARKEGIEQKT